MKISETSILRQQEMSSNYRRVIQNRPTIKQKPNEPDPSSSSTYTPRNRGELKN